MEENKSAKTELLIEKHIDFIVNYGKTHEKYVHIFTKYL